MFAYLEPVARKLAFHPLAEGPEVSGKRLAHQAHVETGTVVKEV